MRCLVSENSAVGTFNGDITKFKIHFTKGGGGGVYSKGLDSILISDSAFKSNVARGTRTVCMA